MQYIKCKIQNTEYGIRNTSRAFTLVETMVAISLITIAIVAPLALTTRSFAGSFYARDQITAYHLAQEAIESVRHARDSNVLQNALGNTVNLLTGFPSINSNNEILFTVDTTNNNLMTQCSACPALRRSPEGLYGYTPSWTQTQFTRIVKAKFEPNSGEDEIVISAEVSWRTGSYLSRSFKISENLFRWVNDGTAAR